MSNGDAAGGAGRAIGEEREPDYRVTLADEHTFLAWLRTALALDAAGIALVHLLPELLVPGVRELAGVTLVVLGAVVAGSAYSRWRRSQQALRQGRPLPASRLPAVLVVALTVISVLAVALAGRPVVAAVMTSDRLFDEGTSLERTQMARTRRLPHENSSADRPRSVVGGCGGPASRAKHAGLHGVLVRSGTGRAGSASYPPGYVWLDDAR